MKGYVIYKFSDKETVTKELENLQLMCPSLELLLLPEVPLNKWKIYANKKIKEADCAIFFVGKEAHKSINIDWELKRFIKLEKPIYTIKLEKENIYNDVLVRQSRFGNVNASDSVKFMYSKEVSIDGLVKILNNNLEFDVGEDISCHLDMDPKVLIEQYKAYLQTSEDVVSRRQSVSNFYITVNSTLISVLSTIVAILNILGAEYSLLITIIGCYLIPFLGVILCFNWRRLVYSYGQLNAAKMKVISAIEKNLPFNIYDVEWKVQTDKLGKRKYVSFTKIEKLIPLLFSVIYVVIFIVAIALTILYLI